MAKDGQKGLATKKTATELLDFDENSKGHRHHKPD
jgi:hypothetical protein